MGSGHKLFRKVARGSLKQSSFVEVCAMACISDMLGRKLSLQVEEKTRSSSACVMTLRNKRNCDNVGAVSSRRHRRHVFDLKLAVRYACISGHGRPLTLYVGFRGQSRGKLNSEIYYNENPTLFCLAPASPQKRYELITDLLIIQLHGRRLFGALPTW